MVWEGAPGGVKEVPFLGVQVRMQDDQNDTASPLQQPPPPRWASERKVIAGGSPSAATPLVPCSGVRPTLSAEGLYSPVLCHPDPSSLPWCDGLSPPASSVTRHPQKCPFRTWVVHIHKLPTAGAEAERWASRVISPRAELFLVTYPLCGLGQVA